MEMLVVISIISIFAGVIGYGFLRGSANSTVGLQASQSIVMGLLTQARSQAILTGRPSALLVNDNQLNVGRFRRYLVVVSQNDLAEWIPIDAGVYLPDACYMLGVGTPTSAETTGGVWSGLNSDGLLLPTVSLAVEQAAAEQWQGIAFTSRGSRAGSMTTSVKLVVASGTKEAPDALLPFRYSNPQNVRGVSVSMTGQFRLLNRKEDF